LKYGGYAFQQELQNHESGFQQSRNRLGFYCAFADTLLSGVPFRCSRNIEQLQANNKCTTDFLSLHGADISKFKATGNSNDVQTMSGIWLIMKSASPPPARPLPLYDHYTGQPPLPGTSSSLHACMFLTST